MYLFYMNKYFVCIYLNVEQKFEIYERGEIFYKIK